MFSHNPNEFFSNEHFEGDDFPSDFFPPMENNPNSLPIANQQPALNNYQPFIENDGLQIDWKAIKNLKSQIINSDLLIENNERLRKKVIELEAQIKDLKQVSIRNREQDHQRIIALESKLKAAEMMNGQYKEQLAYFTKERDNNPQIKAYQDRLKQQDKIAKYREEEVKSKEKELIKKLEDLRQKDLYIEELRAQLSVQMNNNKKLKSCISPLVGTNKNTQNAENTEVIEVVDEKGDENEKNQKNNNMESEIGKDGFEKRIYIVMKKRIAKMKKTCQRMIKNAKIYPNSEEIKIEQTKIQENIFNSLPQKMLEILEKDQEIQKKIKEFFPISQENLSKNDQISSPSQIEKPSLKCDPMAQIQEIPDLSSFPLNKIISKEDLNSDEKIKKIQRKSYEFSKELEEMLLPQVNQRDVFKRMFFLYYKKKFVECRGKEIENNGGLLSKVLLKASEGFNPMDLIEMLDQSSRNYEPYESSQALEEFLFDLMNISQTKENFNQSLEGLVSLMNGPFIISRKWTVKTKNPKFFSEEKQNRIIEFIVSKQWGYPFDYMQEHNKETEFFIFFRNFISLNPLSMQLNNNILDIIVLNLLQVYQRSNNEKNIIVLFYKLFTQKIFIQHPETLINLIYMFILVHPKVLQDRAETNLKQYDYEILGLLEMMSGEKEPSFEYNGEKETYFGPMTLQFLRMSIVETCLRWIKINNDKREKQHHQNPFIQSEIFKKCFFILIRLYELLPEIQQKTHSLFSLFDYNSTKELFNDALLEKRWFNGNNSNLIYPFRGVQLDENNISSFLTSILITLLDKNLVFWDVLGWQSMNGFFNLKGLIDVFDIISAVDVYKAYMPFLKTGLLQKNLLGLVYNRKYDLTFQKTFALFLISFLTFPDDKEMIELLIAAFQDAIPQLRLSLMDRIMILGILNKKFNINCESLYAESKEKFSALGQKICELIYFNRT